MPNPLRASTHSLPVDDDASFAPTKASIRANRKKITEAELNQLGIEFSSAPSKTKSITIKTLILLGLGVIYGLDVTDALGFSLTSLYVIVIFLTLTLGQLEWIIGVTLLSIILNLLTVHVYNISPPHSLVNSIFLNRLTIGHMLLAFGAQVPAGIITYQTLLSQQRLETNRIETFRQHRRLFDLEREARLAAEEAQMREHEARTEAEAARQREAAASLEVLARANELERIVARLEQAQNSAKKALSERNYLRLLTESFQRKLLPYVPEFAAGGQLSLGPLYQPAIQEMQMGGDFYDAIPLPNGCVGLVIGDVAGHGVEAAAQTAFATTTIRAFAAEDPTMPSRVLERVNRILTLDRQFDDFVSVFYGVYDPSTRQICYANAGHEPPILRRESGAIEALDTAGIVIGVIEQVEYQEHTVDFLPGDCLIMLTDGMTEARKADTNELLGWHGVAKIATDHATAHLKYQRQSLGDHSLQAITIDANELAYELYHKALEFAGADQRSDEDNETSPGLNDDVALLVVVAHQGDTNSPI